MSTFQYHSMVLKRFPSIVGGIILAHGVRNGPTPPALLEAYQQEQRQVKEHIGNTPLSQVASLSAWRSAFRGFHVDPTQYRCAAEALLRRLIKKGDIPSINLLVDLGNLISIRYALPVAVIDTQNVQGAVTVHFSRGDERYTTLGQDAQDPPKTGEVIFSDEAGEVIARRWCWRQSESSSARDTTSEVIITIEAHHLGGRADIEAALHDLQALLTTYTGGIVQSGILGASCPVITHGAGVA